MKTLRRFIATNEILMTATVTARAVGKTSRVQAIVHQQMSVSFHEFLLYFDEFLFDEFHFT